MESSILVRVVLPLALFIIMLGMGMTLVPADFSRVVKRPKAVATALTLQFIGLPLFALLAIQVFGLTGALAVGLFVLALSPGGTTSNMLTYLARGEMALSITLTGVISLISPFTIPLLLSPALQHFMADGKEISLPVGKTIIELLIITVVPVVIGMTVRRKAPKFAAKTENPLKWLSLGFLLLIIAGIVRENIDQLPTFFAKAGPAALLLNVLALSAGYFAAKLLKLGHAQSVTLGLEIGIQNGTIALLITGKILQNAEMSIPPAMYSLIMFFTGGLFVVIMNRIRKKYEASGELGEDDTEAQPTP